MNGKDRELISQVSFKLGELSAIVTELRSDFQELTQTTRQHAESCMAVREYPLIKADLQKLGQRYNRSEDTITREKNYIMLDKRWLVAQIGTVIGAVGTIIYQILQRLKVI